MEAVSTRLEAIAIRLEAIANRLEAISTRLEAIANRLEAIANRLEAMPLPLMNGRIFRLFSPRSKVIDCVGDDPDPSRLRLLRLSTSSFEGKKK